jgi:hypothetical protein
MQAKFLFPFTIIVLIVIFAFAVQPIQAAPSFQTVPTARPNNTGGDLSSPTPGGPVLTPTPANGAGQSLSSLTTIYICGGLLFIAFVIALILIVRRRRNSPGAS